MKVLVATRRLNGQRKNDIYEFKGEGEIVVPLPHLGVGEFADDDDGNARCMFGILTGQRTTTALVKHVPVTDSALIMGTANWLRARYPDLALNYEKQAAKSVVNVIQGLEHIAVGQIVECRDLRILIRQLGKTV